MRRERVIVLAGMCLVAALVLSAGCALHLHVGERHYHGEHRRGSSRSRS